MEEKLISTETETNAHKKVRKAGTFYKSEIDDEIVIGNYNHFSQHEKNKIRKINIQNWIDDFANKSSGKEMLTALYEKMNNEYKYLVEILK